MSAAAALAAIAALAALASALLIPAGAIPTQTATTSATLTITTHMQTYGWTDGEADGTAGLPGENKRVEALAVELADAKGGVEYAVYVEGEGWLEGADGSQAGTTGQSTSIRALKVSLTGEAAEAYDVWYRVWVDGYGWTGWARNGAACGTSTSDAMVEAVQIVLLAKGSAAPGDVTPAYITSSFSAGDEEATVATSDEGGSDEAEDADSTDDGESASASADSSSESASAQAASSASGTQGDSDSAAGEDNSAGNSTSSGSGDSTSSADDSSGDDSSGDAADSGSTSEDASTSDDSATSDDASGDDSADSSTASPYAWVGELDVAQSVSQLIIVSVEGSSATLSMYTKSSGEWTLVISTSAAIGYNGIGKTAEGDGKTPTGVYYFTKAFGNNSNPGTSLSYLQVDDTYYWVDDSSSAYYNQLVSTNDVEADWSSAEHIASYPTAYAYCLALSYNSSCTPGKGSAIFLHCSTGGSTAGCIAISQSAMVTVLQNVTSDCAIIIDYSSNIANY